jgi:hypothetical protein
MTAKSLFLHVIASLVLTSTFYGTAFKINRDKTGAFGIFEVVDCGRSGARPKILKTRNGDPELYCVAAKPIVDRTHLKWAESLMIDRGYPYLSLKLSKDGGRIKEELDRVAETLSRKKGDAPTATQRDGGFEP